MLRKNIYKKPVKNLQNTSYQKNLNKNKGECRWPKFIHGTPVLDCNFEYDIISQHENYNIVELPKGTKLYHTTFTSPITGKWWKKTIPVNKNLGGVFFTSSETHQSLHSGTHMLVYETKCDIKLVYIQNLNKNFDMATGNDFVKSFHYSKIKVQEPSIYGYMGCNECEIFLENSVIKKCIYVNPIEVIDKQKFID